MDAPCPVLGRPASDGECGTTILAATPDQMARCRQCDRGIALMASVRRKPGDLLSPTIRPAGAAPRAVPPVASVLKDDPTPAAPAAQHASQPAQATATRKAPKEAPMTTYGTCKGCGAKNRALPCRSLCSSCYAAFRERRKKWVALGNTGDPAPGFTGEEAAPSSVSDVAPIPPLGQQEGQGPQAEGDQMPGSESAGDAPEPFVGYGNAELVGKFATRADETAENKAVRDALAAAADGGPSVYHVAGQDHDLAADAADAAANVPPADIPALETALSSMTDKVAAKAAGLAEPAPASAPATGGVMIGGRLFAPLLAEGLARKPSLTVYRKRCRLNVAALRALDAEHLEQAYVALYWSEDPAQLALRILPAKADGTLHLRFAKPRNKGAEFSTSVLARKFPVVAEQNSRFALALQDGFLLAGAPVAGGAAKVEG